MAEIRLSLTEEQQVLKKAVYELCKLYPSEYWRELDEKREYPEAFVQELTKAGYLAALIPEQYGGSGLGILDAGLILEEINRSGGNAAACHAQLTLLHVIEHDAPETVHGETHLAVPEAADAYLRDVTTRLTAMGADVDAHVHPNEEHDVARSTAEHAHELRADLVALTTHGSGGLRGLLVGSIAQPGQFEAILAIPQEEMDFVHAGQEVELFLAQTPGHRRCGKIAHIATEQLKNVSPRLAARGGGDLATKTTEDGREAPLAVVYQASVPLEDATGQIAAGVTGTARIHAGWQPLGERVWRSFCRTFHFEL